MYFMENISSVVLKKSEKIFFDPYNYGHYEKKAQKSKFLGFFRNHTRNVLHFFALKIKIFLAQKRYFLSTKNMYPISVMVSLISLSHEKVFKNHVASFKNIAIIKKSYDISNIKKLSH
jgi:hypothetical protein